LLDVSRKVVTNAAVGMEEFGRVIPPLIATLPMLTFPNVFGAVITWTELVS
jgi:hypothetical protein